MHTFAATRARLAAAVIFTALGILACSPSNSSGGQLDRPNILFVLSDDQRADALSCMPKLRKLLGTQGTTFENNFASTPLCCPSRASILTGKYAHGHGVRRNESVKSGGVSGAIEFILNGNQERVFAKWFRSAGYRTGYIGKYLNGYELLIDRDSDGDGRPDNHVPPYWDTWQAFSRVEYYWFQLIERDQTNRHPKRVCYAPSDRHESAKSKSCLEHADSVEDGAENYSTDVLADKAVEFVARAAADGVPFFLFLAPLAPHGPFTSPARYQADPHEVAFTPLAMERLGSCDLFEWDDRPPSFLEADVSDKPRWIQDLPGKFGRTRLDDLRRQQLVSALAIEDAAEKVLGALETSGQRSNTVVVYTSDNGYAWGEHGYGRKNCAYDECSRVPLIIYDPRFPRAAAVQREMVLNVDLAPTFSELAGISPPPEAAMNGTSLVGLARGTVNDWPRDHVLTECWGLGKTNCPKGCPDIHAAVRTLDWMYVEHYEDDAMTKVKTLSDGRLERELYDLTRDPFELDNLLLMSASAVRQRGYTQAQLDARIKDLRPKLEATKRE